MDLNISIERIDLRVEVPRLCRKGPACGASNDSVPSPDDPQLRCGTSILFPQISNLSLTLEAPHS